MTDTSPEYIAMCDCPEILKASRRYRDSMSFWRDANYPEFIGSPKAVWLPRQDQLQEMVSGSLVYKLDKFDEWRNSNYLEPGLFNYARSNQADHIFNSMEQLWLSFVMWELHQKQWGRGAWA